MTSNRGETKIKPGVPAPAMAGRLGGAIGERGGVEYRELRAAGLLNRFNTRTRPMPFGWTANPYRGCEMGCRYCYARYTHEFLGENNPWQFERRVYVKNAEPATLVTELTRARRSGLLVAIGAATDPYQPGEARFGVTRRVLEAARAAPGVRLSITTKSALVARDAGLLADLARRSEVSVNFSITTLDAGLARRLEPRAPRPDLRLAAMRALTRAGVPTALFLMPVLPYLTDDEAGLRAVLGAARDAGAGSAVWNVLFLRAGTREFFLEFLAAEFPGLVPGYRRLYAGSAYAARAYVARVEARVARLAEAAAFPGRRRCDRTPDAPADRQLTLVW